MDFDLRLYVVLTLYLHVTRYVHKYPYFGRHQLDMMVHKLLQINCVGIVNIFTAVSMNGSTCIEKLLHENQRDCWVLAQGTSLPS